MSVCTGSTSVGPSLLACWVNAMATSLPAIRSSPSRSTVKCSSRPAAVSPSWKFSSVSYSTTRRMRGRSFFYFRDPDALKDVPEDVKRSTYLETDSAFQVKLAVLKEKIRASGVQLIEDYPASWNSDTFDRPTKSLGRLDGLEAFGERVYEQLWRAIQIEHTLLDAPPAPAGQDELRGWPPRLTTTGAVHGVSPPRLCRPRRIARRPYHLR